MGGSNSGRYGGRPTVESGLTLNLCKLMRDGLVRPGESQGGSLVWSYVGTGEKIASVSYRAFLKDKGGQLRLIYTTTRQGEKRESDYSIDLATTPQPFGGRRWWFVCPRRGDLVSKLYLPAGALTFASRRAYRLAYSSQRKAPHDRALDRAFKMRRRLGSDDGIGDFILKPKGMRWRTFDREMARIEAQERIVDARLWYFVKKLGVRL